jgi:hypothetical protein
VSNYETGRRYEYRTMRRLEAEGYSCHRTAGSHGVWDVCAVRKDHVRFIQVKAGSARCGPIELAAFEEWQCPRWCTREIWTWHKRARDPIVEVL